MEQAVSVLLVLCLFGMVRNEIVYRVNLRRLNEIHEANVKDIANGSFELDTLDRRYAQFREPNYHLKLMLDLSLWTYMQFYPEPVQ